MLEAKFRDDPLLIRRDLGAVALKVGQLAYLSSVNPGTGG